MAKPFSELVKKMSPKARAKGEARFLELQEEMALGELRKARQLSQEKLAVTLQTKQASISKMEKRTDMYISTLRSYVEAMGGELKITASFPEGDVRIKQFQSI